MSLLPARRCFGKGPVCVSPHRNYGRLLVDLAATVPDGLVCFFVSYLYMDQVVSKWRDMGILDEAS